MTNLDRIFKQDRRTTLGMALLFAQDRAPLTAEQAADALFMAKKILEDVAGRLEHVDVRSADDIRSVIRNLTGEI